MKAHLFSSDICLPWVVSAFIIFRALPVGDIKLTFMYSAAIRVCSPQVDKKFLRNQKFAKLNNKAQQQ